MKERQFKLNEYITLKFKFNSIFIFKEGKYCGDISLTPRFEKFAEINGIKPYKVDKEAEFLAQCSNIQEWVENNYDTRIFNFKVAFPLLKKLSDLGDSKFVKDFILTILYSL